MRPILKILLIGFMFFVVAIILGIVKQLNGGSGGLIGGLLLIGLFFGTRAIWKYNPEKENNNSDKHNLKKN